MNEAALPPSDASLLDVQALSDTWADRWFRRRSKTSLAVTSAAAFAVTWVIAAGLGVPANPGFDGSLLMQAAWVSAIVAVMLSLALNAWWLRVVLGRAMGMEISFALAIGLLAFAARGGSMVDLLHFHGGGVFVLLILETFLLYGALYAVSTRIDLPVTPADDEKESTMQTRGTALLVAAVVMIVAMHVLCQSPAKKQAIFCTSVSAAAGATVAFSFLGEMSVLPYVLAPGAVAVAGYVMAMFGATSPLGKPTQVLAYALPLHYVGAGIAGSLLGYWTGLGWKQESENEEGG